MLGRAHCPANRTPGGLHFTGMSWRRREPTPAGRSVRTGEAPPPTPRPVGGASGFPGGGVSVNRCVYWRSAGRNPRVGAPPPHPSWDLKGQEELCWAEVRTKGAGMRRCPCRGGLSEAEPGALPAAAARMGLETPPRGGRRRQPGQQRPGPGAGGPAGRPEGGGPWAGTTGSCLLHSEREQVGLGPETGADRQREPEAAGRGAEPERPGPTPEADRPSSLRTRPERSGPWSELEEAAGPWAQAAGTDGFCTDPRRPGLQPQPPEPRLGTQASADVAGPGAAAPGPHTQPARPEPRAGNRRPPQKSSGLRPQPEGAWREPYTAGSGTRRHPEGPWTESPAQGSRTQPDPEAAWKRAGADGFPTPPAADGSWAPPGTAGARTQGAPGPQTEPGTDCFWGEPNQDGPLAAPEPGPLVTYLYSHLGYSALTAVPRLVITPETPEPEAQSAGLPTARAEVGSGGFSSASSFDESEDDVGAGVGGASDPEDRSGVSRRPILPLSHIPPNPLLPCLCSEKFSSTYPRFQSPGTSSVHLPSPSDNWVTHLWQGPSS